MLDKDHRFRLLHHLEIVNRSLRSATADRVTASAERIARGHTRVAAVLPILERAESRRMILEPDSLGRAGDRSIAAETLAALIRLREIRKRFVHHADRSALLNEVLEVVTTITRTDL